MKSKQLLSTFSFLLLCSCSHGDHAEDSNHITQESRPSSVNSGLELTSNCGVSYDHNLHNPAPNYISVKADPVNSDVVIITKENGNQQLVKLHGISSSGLSGESIQAGINLMRGKLAAGALFVPAGNDCSLEFEGGGLGVYGQLFSLAGENMNELLIKYRAAVPVAEICLGNELAQCYTSLPLNPLPTPTPTPVPQSSSLQNSGSSGSSGSSSSSSSSSTSSSKISWFLWKPKSERDGNLAILVNPTGIDVRVNGQSLTNHGPSNGRGTTARASKSGCAFGNNARVEFFKGGRRVLVANGQTHITVSSGCSRMEKRY